MAQSNVVREPSMDEILASIRRIIESNDPVPSAGLATAGAEPQGFSGHPANDEPARAEPAARMPEPAAQPTARQTAQPMPSDAARRSPAPGPSAEPRGLAERAVPPPAPESRTLSLADVAARVRAASERNSAFRDLQMRSGTIEPEHPDDIDSPSGLVAAPAETERLEPAPIRAETLDKAEPASFAEHGVIGDFQAPDDEDVHLEIDAELDERARDLDRTFDRSAADVAEERAFAEPESRQPLVSTETGLQVARSFEDLVAAMNLSERRSLDEIAEDMLRPMLQEWLDDNLPTLVERLVREEIERVARGPRR